RLLAQFLQQAGYVSQTAVDGFDGWQRVVDGQRPEVIVTDIEMPIWSGLQLLQHIKQSPNSSIRRIPIVVCSTLQDRDFVAQILSQGASRFLPKPIDLTHLLEVIVELLEE
ncbi:MAG: response regulator, partial [Planctomycetales bacterium]|nr:response regulator [Planctomycetales bacterium]